MFFNKTCLAHEMAAEGDNLDARMEAIRLKNDELEKKHKEIMEDELMAKAMGPDAVVDIKSARNSGPSSHPYDNIDLDFDVKDTDKELVKNADYKPKSESCEQSCYLHLHLLFSCFLLISNKYRSKTAASERAAR